MCPAFYLLQPKETSGVSLPRRQTVLILELSSMKGGLGPLVGLLMKSLGSRAVEINSRAHWWPSALVSCLPACWREGLRAGEWLRQKLVSDRDVSGELPRHICRTLIPASVGGSTNTLKEASEPWGR